MNTLQRAFFTTQSSFRFGRERPASGFKNFERSLSDNISPTDLPPRILNPFKYINRKFSKVLEFYEEFSGIKEIRLAQEKVEEAGQSLASIQEERRKAFATLLEIQNKLKGIYSQLENTRRAESRYIKLITEEHNLLKQEEMQQEKFKDIEKAERDKFILFTHAVKTTHEKERAQAQKTKYWSIIGSVVGTLIGMIGSSINTQKKQSDLKKLIADSSNTKLELEFNKFLEGYKKVEMTRYSQESTNMDDIMKNATVNGNMEKYLNELIIKTNNILINMEETLKLMENIHNFELYRVKSDNGSCTLFMNLQSLKDTIQYENQQMRNIIWKGCLIVGGAIFTRILF